MERPEGMFDWDEYKAYLNSKEWDEKRTNRLIMDDFKCRLCGNRSNLQVHHIIYPIHFGDEEMQDLITLCRDCHFLIDDIRKGTAYTNNIYEVKVSCVIRFKELGELYSTVEEFRNKFHESDGEFPKGIALELSTFEDKYGNVYYFDRLTISDVVWLRKKFGTDSVRILINTPRIKRKY